MLYKFNIKLSLQYFVIIVTSMEREGRSEVLSFIPISKFFGCCDAYESLYRQNHASDLHVAFTEWWPIKSCLRPDRAHLGSAL